MSYSRLHLTKVLEGTFPTPRWFTGGTLNLAHNCADRHATSTRKDKVPLLWEGEPCDESGKSKDIRAFTYAQLAGEVAKCANVLKAAGLKKGDRVAIYMGMCSELAIAMLASARIGAIHSVIFGGFAPHAISDRINDLDCHVLVTQDVSYRRGVAI